ncbi:MAG: hypothetical protein A2231_12585 [Candidatus Firestonebacteria bacterium RIFOXYA2_FULL_40_8]|nr:MAG: hypothetical protein A2231_12585 [Candidatus Firestonebacteria bacterium RIFOXYA2_FULL_40_8]
MKNKLNKFVLCMLFLAAGNVFGAEAVPAAPVDLKTLVEVLPWVGSASKDMPAKIILQKESVIVAIGDSITKQGGYLKDCDAALAELYPELKIPKIVNAGIGGQKAEDLVKRFEKDVVELKPDIVTISIGINDVWHRMKAAHDLKVLETYKENVEKMVDMAQSNKIKVILLAPTIINENRELESNKRLKFYVDGLKAISVKKKCGFVDLRGMFLEALTHQPPEVKRNWLTKDGVHMKPLGDAIMAVGVLRAFGVSDKEIEGLK